jgi:polyisoprenyl-teichoic acid--peptidoglycan teichoic acid transferase
VSPSPATRKEIARARTWQRRRRTLTRIAVIAGIVLGVGASVAIGYAAFVAAQFDASTNIVPQPFVDETLRPTPAENDSRTFLVMGTDTRGSLGDDLNARGSRSDTILVVRVAADRQNIHVISIPRDSWVPIRGFGNGKINWALSYGGVKLAVDTIENLLDTRIDHTILIDFNGVRKISSLVGGVPVDNPVAFDVRGDTLEHFDKGRIVIEGERALMFVRERHAFAEGDVSRIANQQLFIKGFLNRLVSLDVIANPPRLTELFQSIGESLLVDKGFNSGFILGLGAELVGFSTDQITFLTLPFTSAEMLGTQFVVNVDMEQVRKIRKHLRSDSLSDYIPPALPSTVDWP